MFDIGLAELGVVAVVALLVLGPERLPRAAYHLGRWFGRAQRAMTRLKATIADDMAHYAADAATQQPSTHNRTTQPPDPEKTTQQANASAAKTPPTH